MDLVSAYPQHDHVPRATLPSKRVFLPYPTPVSPHDIFYSLSRIRSPHPLPAPPLSSFVPARQRDMRGGWLVWSLLFVCRNLHRHGRPLFRVFLAAWKTGYCVHMHRACLPVGPWVLCLATSYLAMVTSCKLWPHGLSVLCVFDAGVGRAGASSGLRSTPVIPYVARSVLVSTLDICPSSIRQVSLACAPPCAQSFSEQAVLAALSGKLKGTTLCTFHFPHLSNCNRRGSLARVDRGGRGSGRICSTTRVAGSSAASVILGTVSKV